MLTFCRSGLYALMIAGVSLSVATAASPSGEGVWESRIQRTQLDDESLLNEYIAEAPSYTDDGARIRTTFIPRFSCAPLTSIVISSDSPLALALGPEEEAELDFFVDGTPIPFPALIDRTDTEVEVHFHGALERRIQLRLLIDKGDRAAISAESETSVEFSLIGSTVSHNVAKKNCREHQSTASE